jgi:hypothetical protein
MRLRRNPQVGRWRGLAAKSAKRSVTRTVERLEERKLLTSAVAVDKSYPMTAGNSLYVGITELDWHSPPSDYVGGGVNGYHRSSQ